MDATSPPPAKRQRTLACRRCRHRKQKCDDGRPCQNCDKAGEECIPTEPAPRVGQEYVKALEERVAGLESLDQAQCTDHWAGPLQLARNTLVSDDDNAAPTAVARNEPPQMSISNTAAPLARPEPPATNVVEHAPGVLHSSPFSLDSNVQSRGLGTGVGYGLDSRWTALRLNDSVRSTLINTYLQRAQSQCPFLHWPAILQWKQDWEASQMTQDLNNHEAMWKGFFVTTIYAVASMLLPVNGGLDHQQLYHEGLELLQHALDQPDEILHVQAHLLLTMYALHTPSTSRIISLASTTMRYCVQAQYHLREAEPYAINGQVHFWNQMRRRVFWCAYMLDRHCSASFDLPPSISDNTISVRMFANIEDSQLATIADSTGPGEEIQDVPGFTDVAPAIHLLQCRRIQSEMLSYTLHKDHASLRANSLEWTTQILTELQNWKAQVQRYADPNSKGYTSRRWLAMIYHYSLLMLFRPTKESILGPAGDWCIQASAQACIIFRKCQIERQIARPWLGLLVQFQSGIVLLYCFWATPPAYRTDYFHSMDVADAVRACSNTIAILVERWANAECLQDVFELLAHEIPITEHPARSTRRVSQSSARRIQALLPQLRRLVVHRPTIRMIEEMVSEDVPRTNDLSTSGHSSTASQHFMTSLPSQPGNQNQNFYDAELSFELPFEDGTTWMPAITSPYSRRQTGSTDFGQLSYPGIFGIGD